MTESVTAFDPAAAHYQDPEARKKLRVYLASPQKFDEAIEFGFPSVDALGGEKNKESATQPKAKQRRDSSDLSAALRTFLADDDDDKMSLNSDQASEADPDSPKTPETVDRPVLKPLRFPTDPVLSTQKPTDSYAQMPVSSREMTLRMTLTRPDLRANEDQIYGWQKPGFYSSTVAARRSQSSPLREELMIGPTFLADLNPKQSLSSDRMLSTVDHWSTGPDGGLVRRIWNRVRRS
jgi:hypothetical protein